MKKVGANLTTANSQTTKNQSQLNNLRDMLGRLRRSKISSNDQKDILSSWKDEINRLAKAKGASPQEEKLLIKKLALEFCASTLKRQVNAKKQDERDYGGYMPAHTRHHTERFPYIELSQIAKLNIINDFADPSDQKAQELMEQAEAITSFLEEKPSPEIGVSKPLPDRDEKNRRLHLVAA